MIASNNIYRILSEERGNVRWVVNTATGAIAQQLAYDEFGRVTADSNPGFQPFGFAGGLYDPDTGLVRFGARDYSPETGRWTARDPLNFDGGAFNLYAYAFSDPINVVDSLGTGPDEKDIEPEHTAEHALAGLILERLGFALQVGIDHSLKAADHSSRIVGEAVNSLTGNALGRAHLEAKGVDLRSDAAKQRPYNPWTEYRDFFFK